MPIQHIPYYDEELLLEAFVAYPAEEKRPVVILCHAWRGRDEFICEKAECIAKLGYVGFALDLYGKGVLGKSKEENAALKKPFLEDRQLLQRRLFKALDVALSLPYVDQKQVAAVGFGFGGVAALDLARSGKELKGAVSVYGHFESSPIYAKTAIKSKILVLHGYDDPIVTLNQLKDFEKEMNDREVDWQAQVFGNTFHAFATPSANDPQAGILYNPLSAKRAWQSVENFLHEIFA